MMDSSSSLELTTNKRQQPNSFNMLSVNLTERGVSEGDQSNEGCDQEANQPRRVNSSEHDEREDGEDEDEDDDEDDNNESVGTDQRESNIDDENDEREELQVVGHMRDQINGQINLEESNSFDSSAHDDYISNQRQVEVEINRITLPALAAPTIQKAVSMRVSNDSSRSPSSQLMQSQHNQQDPHHYQRQQLHQQHQHRHKSLHNNGNKEFDEVKQVELFGISIVALIINGKERLCLAQISNTLLKEFSYNEIHNRRVALGITCIQCTPIQLEMLRRAGAMPSSSRRCGMITMREAERLCRSFLVEEQPPELPENFYFTVAHRVNYGCKGRFVPARYISSRAKCIECFYCGEYYSPNKFIFHSHRQPHATDCNPPDSPNINSWRKHIDLDWTQEHSQDIKYAWEDVKSLFNGGTRRRAPNQPTNMQSTPSTGNGTNAGSNCGSFGLNNQPQHQQRNQQKQHIDDEQLIVDVECDDSSSNNDNNKKKKDIGLRDDSNEFRLESSISSRRSSNKVSIWPSNGSKFGSNHGNRPNQQNKSLMFSKPSSHKNNQVVKTNQTNGSTILSTKRLSSSNPQSNQMNKRFATTNNMMQQPAQIDQDNHQPAPNNRLVLNEPNVVRFQAPSHPTRSHFMVPTPINGPQSHTSCQPNFPFNSPSNLINQSNSPPLPPPSIATTNISSARHQQQKQTNSINEAQSNAARKNALSLVSYPMSTTSNFIYSQLYSQLIQSQAQTQTQMQHQATSQPQHSATLDAQIALRHHIWSSLLANLQCNANNQTYSMQQNNVNHCNSSQQLITPETADSIPSPANLSHLFSSQLYSQPSQQQHTNQVSNKTQTEPNLIESPYKSNQNVPFSLHKSFPAGETNDI